MAQRTCAVKPVKHFMAEKSFVLPKNSTFLFPSPGEDLVPEPTYEVAELQRAGAALLGRLSRTDASHQDEPAPGPERRGQEVLRGRGGGGGRGRRLPQGERVMSLPGRRRTGEQCGLQHLLP